MGVYNCSEGAIALRYYMKRRLTEPWHMYGSTFHCDSSEQRCNLGEQYCGINMQITSF